MCTGMYEIASLKWFRLKTSGTHFVGCEDRERCMAAVVVQSVVKGAQPPHPPWCICVACTHTGVL